MKNFDLHRFGQALKCQLMVGRKLWIRLFSIFTLVMFMAGLFWTRIQGTPYKIMETWGADELYHSYERHVTQSVVFAVVFFCIAMLFGAGGMFSQMKDTRTRSAYLLWPVSNLEKYVISLLLSVVLMAVVTIGAFMFADALRVFVDWVTGRVVIWGLPKFADGVFLGVLLPLALYRGRYLVPSPAVPADQCHHRRCFHPADHYFEPDRLAWCRYRIYKRLLGREDTDIYQHFPSFVLYPQLRVVRPHHLPLLGFL